MAKQQIPSWAKRLFTETIENSKFEIDNLPIKDSKEWTVNKGAIVHKSGLFFKIVGTKWCNLGGNITTQPLIEQREIGTLGFMIFKNGETNKILVQAKIEPGNIGICQIAPTYQATASNSAKVHGGKVPVYKEYFENNLKNTISQVLQSEQGSRFLAKLNRNVLVISKTVIKPSTIHKWIDVDKLLDSLELNYLINTDARSVLVCCPWKVLAHREPFTKNNKKITKLMRNSYITIRDNKNIEIKNKLKTIRSKLNHPEVVDIRTLKNWKLKKYGLIGTNDSSFSVKQISVRAENREVKHWDQPIISSNGVGYVDLLCAYVGGVLQFLFIPYAEPGLVHKVELGPSVIIHPGENNDSDLIEPNGEILAKVMQSDEGGRFFQDKTRYRIVYIRNIKQSSSPKGFWLTLGETKQLLLEEGIFNNEARSVLSLVLKWL